MVGRTLTVHCHPSRATVWPGRDMTRAFLSPCRSPGRLCGTHGEEPAPPRCKVGYMLGIGDGREGCEGAKIGPPPTAPLREPSRLGRERDMGAAEGRCASAYSVTNVFHSSGPMARMWVYERWTVVGRAERGCLLGREARLPHLVNHSQQRAPSLRPSARLPPAATYLRAPTPPPRRRSPALPPGGTRCGRCSRRP